MSVVLHIYKLINLDETPVEKYLTDLLIRHLERICMNYKMFRAINRLAGRNSTLDTFMIFISQKTRFLYIFLLALMWFRNNSYKKIILFAGLSVGFALFINCFIQLFYFKPRPFVIHRVRLLIPSKNNSSFPSKHTVLAFALASSVLLRERLFGSIMWFLAILTGFSRIWLGHHYPFDIIGSAFIGILTSIAIGNATYIFNSFVTWIINVLGIQKKAILFTLKRIAFQVHIFNYIT
ncbi:phosphatase PAP2 family protein [Bacillus thuringiensis]|nr:MULTISPECIES: undecaprenyl-diphosphatase [Bacillus]MRB19666.1 phosphatase PAP2 family protein [Bacillus thuringiensis]MDA2005579.1 undecaprenyl-diphosphatase [Bacillus cereus]MDA2045078.1 undecaprenyl-diphosphatase [Bacillus cereus]MDA2473039.1 undecaprenyl-diphosphatase [Bacillus cereus]MDF9498234.1 undecaprenyl-diphosphatase [Bacillus cereus]